MIGEFFGIDAGIGNVRMFDSSNLIIRLIRGSPTRRFYRSVKTTSKEVKARVKVSATTIMAIFSLYTIT